MPLKWLTYYSGVKSRLKIDRHFFEDARVVARLYRHFKFGTGQRKLANDAPTIAFYPQPAGPWYNIWLALQNTNLKISKRTTDSDITFIFDDATLSNAAESLPKDTSAFLINHRITDISKKNVSRIFEDVFGYGLEVDPSFYAGQVVEKSDINGTHDGRLITCPIAAAEVKPGSCYQKFIDSSFTGKTSEDLRIACVYGQVAAVFHKHKSFENRFSTDYLGTTVKDSRDVFSPEEENLIAKFCGEIGLDFGAMDVMRDKHDGRIYIVDVNKTCMPVLSLPWEEQLRSIGMIGKKLEAELRKRADLKL